MNGRLSTRSANSEFGTVDNILGAFGTKSYRSISLLTYLVWEIARRDPALSLEPAFHKDRSTQATLNDALNERLGVKVRRHFKTEEVLAFSDDARQFFAVRPAARTNYAHQLKRAARLAAGLIDLRAAVVLLPDGGLEISGGDVEKFFCVNRVQLTERATLGQAAPISFVDVEVHARAKRGQHLGRHSNTRGRLARPSTEKVEVACRNLRHLLMRSPTLTEAQRSALSGVRDCIAHALA